MSEKKMDWKDTLNLPRTDFPMKAQLSQKEPETLKKWQAAGIYEKILENRARQEPYILHDGPPYANGNIHLGTALNKILKDFVVKSKSMEGFYSPYVPGWDCHGLPIEHKVDQKLGSRKKRHEPAPGARRMPAVRRKIPRPAARRLQAPGRSSATGTGPTPPSTMPTRPRSSASSTPSSGRATSTARSARSTGASPAGPPWPKPRSNTTTTRRPRSR